MYFVCGNFEDSFLYCCIFSTCCCCFFLYVLDHLRLIFI